MIFLQPTGGLCNRMLAIDSGIALAKEIDQELTVLWERYPLLNCNYSDLFKTDQLPFKLIERAQKNYFFRQVDKLSNYSRFEKFIYVRAFKKLRDTGFNFTKLGDHRSIYICGFNRFHGGSNLNNSFRPIDFIKKKINDCTKHFDEHTIGLHLRRTDHMAAINASPTEKFIASMERELEKNPNTNFFLATDSNEEELQLKSLFGQKIRSNKKSLSRDSVEGVQDALVDLRCLAATKKLYGSYKSSFSETAAEIGNNELIIIQ